jgi:multiple sugar transport system substrate-binding protein
MGRASALKARDVAAAKRFVKWLWVDQTEHQLDFATSYGFHIPARTSLIDRASTLKSGVAAEAASIAIEFGQAQTNLLWTPKSNQAFTAAVSRIVKDGADAAGEIAVVQKVAQAELKRVLA